MYSTTQLRNQTAASFIFNLIGCVRWLYHLLFRFKLIRDGKAYCEVLSRCMRFCGELCMPEKWNGSSFQFLTEFKTIFTKINWLALPLFSKFLIKKKDSRWNSMMRRNPISRRFSDLDDSDVGWNDGIKPMIGRYSYLLIDESFGWIETESLVRTWGRI